jgi:two-component system, chemotaxis family, chemotaxis protein CheY
MHLVALLGDVLHTTFRYFDKNKHRIGLPDRPGNMKHNIPDTQRRILIVEHHDGFRQLIGGFLADQFEVVGARNGLEAFLWLNKGWSPDLIITEADLPEVDGAQLLQQLRSSGLYHHIPVIVISETDQTDLQSRFLALGASDYLTKPLNPFFLRERLDKIFQGSAA